jgi:hypothetical protein
MSARSQSSCSLGFKGPARPSCRSRRLPPAAAASPARTSVLAQTPDRKHAALLVRLGNPEQLSYRFLVMQVQRRHAAAISTGMQGQLEVPHRREDRPVQGRLVERLVAVDPRQIRFIARDHEHRNLRYVLDEPLGRRHEPTFRGFARHEVGDHVAADPAQVGLAVECGDLFPQCRTSYDEPPPRLLVRSVGRLQPDAKALADVLEVDGRVEVQRHPRRPGGGEEALDVHDP